MALEISLSAWQKRAIAILLALLPLVLLIWWTTSTALAIAEHHARVYALKREQATYAKLIADLPQRKAELAKAAAFVARDRIFRRGGSASKMAPQIKREIARLVGDTGANIEQNSIEGRAKANSPVLAFYSSVTFTGTISMITKVLLRASNATPYYVVRRVDIHGSAAPVDGNAHPTRPHRLRVRLLLVSYLQPS